MKTLLTIILTLIATTARPGSTPENLPPAPAQQYPGTGTRDPEPIQNMKLKITIGNHTLTATFADNQTAKDFASLLPLTVDLDDYAGKEKIFYPSRKLSTTGAPSGIDAQTGDITYYSP